MTSRTTCGHRQRGNSYGPFSPALIELSRRGISWDKLEFNSEGGLAASLSGANAWQALDALAGWPVSITQTTAPPGPDPYTDPTIKALAVNTLLAPDVVQTATTNPMNEIFGAICRNNTSGTVDVRVQLAKAGETALRCPLGSSKVADLHRHPPTHLATRDPLPEKLQ